MALIRFGNRTLLTGPTNIHLSDWSHKVTVYLPKDAEGTEFAKVLTLDAYGNLRIARKTVQQADIQ